MTWRDEIDKSSREYSIFCKDLSSGKTIEWNAHDVVEAASTIKLPILALLASKFQDKTLSPFQEVQVTQEHIGKNGSGILQYFSLGSPFSLYNLALLMIIESDNAATNVIVELLGKDEINAYIASIGLEHTELLMAKLDFPDDYTVSKQGKVANSSAYEMAQMMELLVTGALLDEEHTIAAMRILSQNQSSHILRFIEDKNIKKSGNKTGAMIDDIANVMNLNDCAFIVDNENNIKIISVFSTGPLDKQLGSTKDSVSRIEIAHIAEQLYEDLNS